MSFLSCWYRCLFYILDFILVSVYYGSNMSPPVYSIDPFGGQMQIVHPKLEELYDEFSWQKPHCRDWSIYETLQPRQL